MTATFITYETGTLGATVAAPDSNTIAGTGLVYDNTHVLNGTKSLKITPASAAAAATRIVTGLNTPQLGVTVPFWYDALATLDEDIFRIEDTGGAKLIGLSRAGSGKLSLTDQLGTAPRLWIGTANPPVSQWIVAKLWIQIGATATTGSVKLAFYNASGAVLGATSGGVDSPFTSSASKLSTVNIDRIWLGRVGTQGSTDARWYDTVGYDPAATDFLPDFGVSPLSGTATVQDNMAVVTVTGSGGTAPYTYAINQTGGTTTPATLVTAGTWRIAKHQIDTLTYTISVTDANTAVSTVSVSVLPIPAGVVWPKHPSGALPSTSWS